MNNTLIERITVNNEIMAGKPTIRGTRLTVEIILEKLASGESEDKIIEDYPILVKEDIRASLKYAAKSLSVSEILEV
jgi:uncharacterized protein (DUF433 family)